MARPGMATTIGGGRTLVNIAGCTDLATAAALRPDDGIIIVGRVSDDGADPTDVGIVALTAQGIRDSAFTGGELIERTAMSPSTARLATALIAPISASPLDDEVKKCSAAGSVRSCLPGKNSNDRYARRGRHYRRRFGTEYCSAKIPQSG